MKLLIVAAAILIGLTACGTDKAQNRTAANEITTAQKAQPKATMDNKGSLLFFLNPNGRPCQMQDQYLNQIRSQIEEVAEIVYIKTTNPDDKSLFYKYGIRSLPSMIILDENDNIAQRFSPGIQDTKTILESLKAVL